MTLFDALIFALMAAFLLLGASVLAWAADRGPSDFDDWADGAWHEPAHRRWTD
jgi:hypothetical protein